ncbi:TonB-dependent siderophore receptor [Psittacicella hinzii]|uniref:Iron complex outermembrane recepter protein n=1 Tax=Psittacicella hinzii TaxID=2028575 RepID=A0A3A1YLT6_9GAMM|nr:TonB-dependent siderophore receptor [Psittacicella hinzii]RIY37950.1 hypothetical protein CKF58_04380 [Psittacicella hinzii]
MTKRLSLTLAALLVALPYAQAETTQVTLDDITVVGSVNKIGNLKFYAPNSTATISTNTSSENGTNQVDAALRYTAGVTSQMYGQDLDDTLWFKVRGFDANVYLDGASLHSSGYTTYSPNLFGLEAIEIAKGADSTVFGPTASGGVVNLVTKKPQTTSRGLFYVNVGNDNQRGIGIDYNNHYQGKILYRVVANYNHQDGETYGTYGESYYLAPSAIFVFTPKARLTVSTSVQKDVGVPTTSFYPVDGTVYRSAYTIARDTNLGNPEADYYVRKAGTFALDYSQEFAQGWSLLATYKYLVFSREQLASYYSYAIQGSNYARGYLFNDTTAHNHSFDTRVAKRFNFTGGNNTTSLGVSYNYNKVGGVYGFGGYFDTYSVLAPNYNITPTDYQNQNPYIVDQRLSSVYLNNQFNYQNLEIDTALRYDYSKITQNTLGVNSSAKDHKTTYAVGAMYNFLNGISPYARYSTSFTPIPGSDGLSAYKPITAHQFEAGVKYVPESFTGKFTVSIFNIQEKNSLVYTTGVARQTGSASAKGFELAAQAQLVKGLDVEIAYTYTDAHTTSSSTGEVTRSPMIPYHTLATKVKYTFGQLPLTLGAGFRYNGTSTDQIGNTKDFKVPSYLLVDLLAKYSINKNLDLMLTVTNLTNKYYVTSCYYTCYLGAARKVNATLSYNF